MKCPACGNKLHNYSTGSSTIDICSEGCAGIWFDKKEYEQCDDYTEAFPPELLRVLRLAHVVVDLNQQRSCPRCEEVTLERKVLDPETRFEIDRCPECEGHWVDHGELERIRFKDKRRKELAARLASYERDPSITVRSFLARLLNSD